MGQEGCFLHITFFLCVPLLSFSCQQTPAMLSSTYPVTVCCTGVEFVRVAMGAGSRTRDMPAQITDYCPETTDIGGFFGERASYSIICFKRGLLPSMYARTSPSVCRCEVCLLALLPSPAADDQHRARQSWANSSKAVASVIAARYAVFLLKPFLPIIYLLFH